MYEDLNNRLTDIRQRLRDRQKLLADLERTQQTLSEQQSRLGDLKAVLGKEKADVDKLEGLGLVSLFHAVLGDKGDRLEKERQEYLAAKLKYDECEYSVSALARDIEGMKERIAALGDLDSQHKEALAEKERLISGQGGRVAGELMALGEQSANLNADAKELNEAIAAGKTALSGLNGVVESLRSAKNWGIYDMVAGGIIATAVKHSKLDGAQQAINQVQHSLRRFQRELADVGASANLEIDITSFLKFADYMFDGLIIDWMVQSRIDKSLTTAQDAQRRIQTILHRLDRGLRDVQAKSEDIEQQKRQIIEKA